MSTPAKTTAITIKALSDAYEQSLKKMNADLSMTSSSSSAGLILEPGKKGQQQGYQVFVKVIRYSDVWLAKRKDNGGLAVRP